jgi:hypothetical protein
MFVGGVFGGSLAGRISSANTHADALASSTAAANIAVACFMLPTLHQKQCEGRYSNARLAGVGGARWI